MLDKEQFFKEFSIDKEYFESTGLVWDELVKIYDNYVALVPQLEKEAEYIVSSDRKTVEIRLELIEK